MLREQRVLFWCETHGPFVAAQAEKMPAFSPPLKVLSLGPRRPLRKRRYPPQLPRGWKGVEWVQA